MPKKIIIIFTLKDYEHQQLISDNLEYAVEIINTFRESIYKPMTKSNLHNILRGDSPLPNYILELESEDFESYIRPYFEEFYPNKIHFTNKGTLQKYYKKVVEYLIEQQTEEMQ